MSPEEERLFNDFIREKSIADKEKYIITETIWYVQEILDWKTYTFEKIRVKVSWVIMLNLKSIEKIK